MSAPSRIPRKLVVVDPIKLSNGAELSVVGLDLGEMRRPWLESDWPAREHLPFAEPDCAG